MADNEQQVATTITTTTTTAPQPPISPQINNINPSRKLSFDATKLERIFNLPDDNGDGDYDSITRPRKESDVSTLADATFTLPPYNIQTENDAKTSIRPTPESAMENETADSGHREFKMKEDTTPRSNAGTESMFRLDNVNILMEKDDSSVATFDNPSSITQKSSIYSCQGDNYYGTKNHQDYVLKASVLSETDVVGNTESSSALPVLDHLDALASSADKNNDDTSGSNPLCDTVSQKLDAFMSGGGNTSASSSRNRDRAESWGGMSDLSHAAAMVEKAFIVNSTSGSNNVGHVGDILNAGTTSSTSSHVDIGGLLSPRSRSRSASIASNASAVTAKQSGVPAKIDVLKGSPPNLYAMRDRFDSLSSGSNVHRERIDSLSSASQRRQSRERLDSYTSERLDSLVNRDRLDSLANLSGLFSRRDRFESIASLGEVSMNMSIADLADIAGNLESVAKDYADLDSADDMEDDGKDTSSARSESTPAPTISVDSEAVQAAVQAALSVTSGNVLDFLQSNPKPKHSSNPTSSSAASTLTASKLAPSNLVDAIPSTTQSMPRSSSKSESEMEAIRARARAAAGYVHPNMSGTTPKTSKKRQLPTCSNFAVSKRIASDVASTPTPTYNKAAPGVHIYSEFATPKSKNTVMKYPYTPPSSAKSAGGQSNQKWEEMYECLVLYVQEQREKETKNMSEEERERWEWSGNVPTMYKTKDGKALGRWINNQRSAKSKGSLKMEREVRLVRTGLKWSVLTTNAWTDMMEELRAYVKEKTKDGKPWDGNVPTNYKIKSNTAADGSEIDEDKNLGRWINRQRSLFQAGKLKKERREELERIGLKWAVLSTSSWLAMYDSLCKYVETQKKLSKDATWDGNVPANQETDDDPPKRLGRWVNRQRSAYANKKLKKEFADKLETLGLKWTAFDVSNKKYYPAESYPFLTTSLTTTKHVDAMNGKPQRIASNAKVFTSSTSPHNGKQYSRMTFNHASAIPSAVPSSIPSSSALLSSASPPPTKLATGIKGASKEEVQKSLSPSTKIKEDSNETKSSMLLSNAGQSSDIVASQSKPLAPQQEKPTTMKAIGFKTVSPTKKSMMDGSSGDVSKVTFTTPSPTAKSCISSSDAHHQERKVLQATQKTIQHSTASYTGSSTSAQAVVKRSAINVALLPPLPSVASIINRSSEKASIGNAVAAKAPTSLPGERCPTTLLNVADTEKMKSKNSPPIVTATASSSTLNLSGTSAISGHAKSSNSLPATSPTPIEPTDATKKLLIRDQKDESVRLGENSTTGKSSSVQIPSIVTKL